MADVEDLFVERIEDESYEFEGEQRPLEIIEELIAVRGQDRAERHEVRLTHHGPIVNQALGADDEQPLALRWAALDEPAISQAFLGGPRASQRAGAGGAPARGSPCRSRTSSGRIGTDRSATRWSAGSRCGRATARTCRSPGGPANSSGKAGSPTTSCPSSSIPCEGYLVTANNSVVESSYPHHITSDWLDGYRAARIEQLLAEHEQHDLDGFRRMQTDLYSIPGDEVVHRLARLEPASQREMRAIERLKSWDRTLGPRTVAGTIYQAFMLRLAREFTRAAIGDRDLAERYLDRADNGFLAHVTSPWRWQAHLLELWDEADEELIGGSWDELALEALRGALDDLEERFGPDPGGWRWGQVHALEFPHALGAAHPIAEWVFNRTLHPGGAQETVAQIAYNPIDPYHAIWAPSWRMVADPSAPERSQWQAFTGQSGHAWSGHYDDLQPRWEAGNDAADGG